MDILAEKLGLHPLEFRYMNSFEAGSITSTGQYLTGSVGLKKCIEKLAEIDNIKLKG
jgi:nicotinate dehydrogenase large molybdopterin subunit